MKWLIHTSIIYENRAALYGDFETGVPGGPPGSRAWHILSSYAFPNTAANSAMRIYMPLRT